MVTEQEMLDQWKQEFFQYPRQCDIIFEGYKELSIPDGYRMGYCECKWWMSNDRLFYMVGKIWLDDDHANCPQLFRDAVLWHEFCHVEDACEYRHVDHCLGFQRRKWRKPKYAFADVLLKLIGWIWFD